MIKLCVGVDSVEELAGWQKRRLADMRKAKKPPRLYHATRMVPKRQDELADGGSLYWVIRGIVQVRQRILGFGDGAKADGTPCCHVFLDPKLVAVYPAPRRAFQGWRYLPEADAPADLTASNASIAQIPPDMRQALAELGLL
jgi:hypothetical protein